jgi:membrane protease YdiL (CAAX protease family)
MASAAVTKSLTPSTVRRLGPLLLAGYVAVYAIVLFGMTRGGFDAGDALAIAAILGVGFSLAAWFATMGVTALPYIVLQPSAELFTLISYLAPLTACVTWGFDAIRRWVPNDPAQANTIMLVKLTIFVGIPAWLMRRRFGYSWEQLAPASARPKQVRALIIVAALMLAFQSILGRGLRDIRAAHIAAGTLLWGIPVALVWIALEAGVVEEFFFRCLLQSRLSAALRSELGGIVVMALLFGLMHAPGLYLRTGVTQENLPAHPSLGMAIGYSIVVTSVAGFFLGVLWARTRNFLVVVAVHAATDLLPGLLPTLRSLHLLR